MSDIQRLALLSVMENIDGTYTHVKQARKYRPL